MPLSKAIRAGTFASSWSPAARFCTETIIVCTLGHFTTSNAHDNDFWSICLNPRFRHKRANATFIETGRRGGHVAPNGMRRHEARTTSAKRH
jgi:hypothetical protein